MEIKVNLSSFPETRAAQTMALENLKDYSNKLQSGLKKLDGAWKGAAGDAFRTCEQEIVAETLIGVFSVTSMRNKLDLIQNTFTATDQNAAASFEKLGPGA